MIPEKFSSKPEAYTYIIHQLGLWCFEYSCEEQSVIKDTIEAFIIAFENHEQKTEQLSEKLNLLLKEPFLSQKHKQLLERILSIFKHIIPQLKQEDNILARRFESELASQLISQPTKKMMEALFEVSEAIIKTIQQSRTDKTKCITLELFLSDLESTDILFGFLKEKPTLDLVISILKKNDSNDFITIQYIAFIFSRIAIPFLPLIDLPAHPPEDIFLAILQEYKKYQDPRVEYEPANYQRMAARADEQGFQFRSFIVDKLFHKDELYTQGFNRGRKGDRKTCLKTNQLGLMKLEHSSHALGLPTITEQTWCSDAQSQDADITSIYYRSAIENDCPYITGPSGMTAYFTNMMFLLLNPKDISLVQAYSLAILGYIVGAGFHSMNEILIPLIKCIKLLPNYPSYQGLEYLTSPPLYHLYFKTIEGFDPEFSKLRHNAWNHYLDYFSSYYMPLCMNETCNSEHNVGNTPPEVMGLKQIITQSIDKCIAFHNQKDYQQTIFFSSIEEDKLALKKLNEDCLKEENLISIMGYLQKYFCGQYTAESRPMNKWDNHSYIRFFIDSLKENSQIIAHLNMQLKFDPPIEINLNLDVFSSEYKSFCIKIYNILKKCYYQDSTNSPSLFVV